MKNIWIETQGVKGGKTQTKEVGYLIACLRHEQDRITIDDFMEECNDQLFNFEGTFISYVKIGKNK